MTNGTNMKINFDDINDRESNKIALLLAHGPSLRNDLSRIFELSKNKKDFATFTTGEASILENAGYFFDLDYWTIANSVFTVQNNYMKINKHKNVTLLYAAAGVDGTKDPESLLTVDFLQFDQRHFNHQNCTKNFNLDISKLGTCCANLPSEYFQKTKTIQEHLRDKCETKEIYSTASTSALHMLTTAILCGCKQIYLFGVDLDYSLGYVDNVTSNNDSFVPYITEIVNDFRIIDKAAKNIGCEIINCSIRSPIAAVLKSKSFNL